MQSIPSFDANLYNALLRSTIGRMKAQPRRQKSQETRNARESRQTYALSLGHTNEERSQSVHQEGAVTTKIIYSINFGEDAMVVVTKTGLLVYSLLTMKVIHTKYRFFWDAHSIPDTSCLALVEHDGTSESKRTLKILDLATDRFIAQLTITFPIETIKVSKHCIAMGGIGELAVVHFPTLRPICHEASGSGLINIYDLSAEGLTLAYQCQAKGVIIVHNFTHIATDQARRKSSLSCLSDVPKSQISASMRKKMQKVKQMVEINAHKESICNIKLSPSGSRVASASNKGTLIRIFLTASGRLWQELRVGYELCRIVDMSFFEEGNVIACLTEKNYVQLFNVKLEHNEESLEKVRRGYDIYQQPNPKSIFSFLSFLNSNFGNELPFAFKQLVKPKPLDEDQKPDQKADSMPVVLEEEEEDKPVYLEEREKNMNRGSELESESEREPRDEVGPRHEVESRDSPEPREDTEQKKERSATLLGSMKKSEKSVPAQFRRRSTNLSKMHKKGSLLHLKKEDMEFVPKVYNTVSRIYVGGNNFIWVAKGSYIFTMKYDPFNGGEMYHQDTMILQ